MLLKNLSLANGLVNGSKGRVIEFQELRDESGALLDIFPVVKFENGLERTVRRESWEIMISGVSESGYFWRAKSNLLKNICNDLCRGVIKCKE